MPKNPAILTLASIIILSLCQQLFAGEINGRTYTSSVYKGLQLTVPSGWAIKDVESKPAPDEFHTVVELKRTQALNGTQPSGDLQAIHQPPVIIDGLASSMAESMKAQGYKVTHQAKIQIDGKPAHELRFVLRKGPVKLEVRLFLMGGSKYIYMLSIYDTGHPTIGEEVDRLAQSFRYM